MNKIIIWVVVIILLILVTYLLMSAKNNLPNDVVQNQVQNTQSTSTENSDNSTSTKQQTSKEHSISITNFAFNPASLTVNKGDTVVWTNNDSAPHQISGGGINSTIMGKTESYSLTLTTTGTIDYYCSIHPSMRGTIIVK